MVGIKNLKFKFQNRIDQWITHIFEDEVNVFIVVGSMDVQQSDNVGVITEMLQEHNFTKCPLGVCLISERVYVYKTSKCDLWG